jgi:hypothetical protein
VSRSLVGPSLLLLLALGACSGESARSSAAAPPSAQAAPATAEPARLVGQWKRTDSDYVIAIDEAQAEGKLAARYLNPRPINVSKAQWLKSGARLQLLVEMQDQGYPGSNYELDYDAAHDTLFGTYHHLGLHQDFQVSFYRLKPEAAGGAR